MALKKFSDVIVDGTVSVVGGTSSQFLKADGTLDSNTYATSSQLTSLVKEEFTYVSGLQTFTLANNFKEIFSISVQGQGSLHSSQYSITTPNKFTILDTLEANDYIIILYNIFSTPIVPGEEETILSVSTSQSIATNTMVRASALNGDITLTLINPAIPQLITIKKIDESENAVFVTSPQLIDGDPIAELSMYQESIMLKWTGTTYDII